MDAEAMFEFYGGPPSEGYEARNAAITDALGHIEDAFDVEAKHYSLTARRVGEYGRGVELTGDEKEVLGATQYLIGMTKEHGPPANPAIDPAHPIKAWRGYRLSSHVLAKEKELCGQLDVAYEAKDVDELMPELESYAKELSEQHGIEVSAFKDIHAYPAGYPAAAPSMAETVGFAFSLEGDVNGIEAVLHEMRDHFEGTPEYRGDIFHPIRSFRGKNVARIVEMER